MEGNNSGIVELWVGLSGISVPYALFGCSEMNGFHVFLKCSLGKMKMERQKIWNALSL